MKSNQRRNLLRSLPLFVAAFAACAAFGQEGNDPLSVGLGPVFPIIGPGTHPALTINPNPGVQGYSAYDAFLFHFKNAGGSSTTIVTFGQHLDQIIWPSRDGMVVSFDRGATWPIYLQHGDATAGFFISGMLQIHRPVGGLQAGTLVAMSYTMQQVKTDPTHLTEYCYTWTSTDDGRHWMPHRGLVTLPAAQFHRPGLANSYRGYGVVGANYGWPGFLFHRSLRQLPDGSIEGTMYGQYQSDHDLAGAKRGYYRVIWVKSSDGGATWNVVTSPQNPLGTVGAAYDPAKDNVGATHRAEGFGEPCAVWAADGSILVVMRSGGYHDTVLHQTRSIDGGRTWTAPIPLPGAPETFGVDPDLALLRNGTLVLSVGERDERFAKRGDPFGALRTYLLFSLDGSGRRWSRLTRTFASASPVYTYTGIREVEPGKLLVATDVDQNPNYDLHSPHPMHTSMQIDGQYVTVKRVRPGPN